MNRQISLIKSIFLSNFKRLGSPYKMTFALTYRCNLKCKICRIWENPSDKKEISIQNIEKIFKSLTHLSWLDLTGGEVTLREDLIEITEAIIKNSEELLIFHISTNGQLPAKILLLVKKVLKSDIIPVVNISIETPSRLTDELRSASGAYSNSLETFRLLKSLKRGYYYFSCTISDYNISYINNLILELKRDVPNFSLSDLHFNVFYNSFHYFQNQNIDALTASTFEKLKGYLILCKNSSSLIL